MTFNLNEYIKKHDYPVDSFSCTTTDLPSTVLVKGDLLIEGTHLYQQELNAQPKTGLKYDNEKPRLGLTPMLALTEVAKVLTYGAKKYAPDNWRKVANLQERYYDAALRHLTEYKYNKIDPESNLPHLAHCICSLMFMLEDQILAEKDC